MDFSRLTMAHKIGLGGGIVLLVSSFLSWYSVGAFGVSFSVSGWSAGFWAWFGILLGLAGAVVLGLKAFGTSDVKAGGLAAEQIAVILGTASVVFIVLRFLTQTTAVAFGLFLGLIGAAGVAFGAFRAMTEAGMGVDDMKRSFGGAKGSGDEPRDQAGPPAT